MNPKQLLGPRDRKKLLNGRRDILVAKLPEDWKGRTIALAPEYDTKKGNDLMVNCKNKKCSHEHLLNIWEQIIDDAEKEKIAIEKRKKNTVKRAKIAFPV